jgi:hypothetical protein
MYYVDADGDGFGDEATGVETCAQPANTVTVGGDCDDADSTVYPGAMELCDGIDNNCNSSIDEGLIFNTYFVDADNDFFGTGAGESLCEDPGVGYVLMGGDCDDTDSTIYPGATEVLDNGIDENCDGMDNYVGLTEASAITMVLTPNPSVGDVSLTVSNNNSFSVEVCDITGKQVLTLNNALNGTVITTRSWAPGTYFVTLRQNQQHIVSKLMVK